MQHRDIWRGLDLLAEKHGLSASRLATLAGLDATAFNKSKRISKDGRLRWPSTESLACALQAVGERFSDFARLIDNDLGIPLRVLELHLAASSANMDARGTPIGEEWETLRFPGRDLSEDVYALEVTDTALQPIYHPGDRLIISPAAPIRSGDRVVVKPLKENVIVRSVGRKTDSRITLRSIVSGDEIGAYPVSDLAWIARIIWVSQ